MSSRSRRTLLTLLDGLSAQVRVIPHGVPDLPFVAPRREAVQEDGEMKLVSFGFFNTTKGFDVALEAVQILREKGLRCRYTIAGSPLPRAPEQEEYLRRIRSSIVKRGLRGSVVLIDRFLERAEQIELIRSADAALFAYQEPAQASSGAVALALAVGRPVVCTPFEYALALRQELDGVWIANDYTAASIAQSLGELLDERPQWPALAERVHAGTREWTWTRVAQTYAAAFADAVSGEYISPRPNRR